MSFLSKIASFFAGGTVKTISDTVDKWHPSPVTSNAMDLENQQAGDESQNSARAMVLPTHDTWLDVGVDAYNRLPRPVITTWVIGGVMGLWELPKLSQFDPITLNMIWLVLSFWLGSRVLIKDAPKLIAAAIALREMLKRK